MTCADCGEELKRKLGRGRSPQRCPACRQVRRLNQAATRQRRFRDAGDRIEQQTNVRVSEAMLLAAMNAVEDAHYVLDKPLEGAHSRKGPFIGHTAARGSNFAGTLEEIRGEALRNPWWDEHPHTFEGI